VINRKQTPIQVLIQKKLRKPYIGEVNPGIAGKIKPAESITNAAERKLTEETGLIGKCKPIGVIRKTRIVENSELVDDGFFFVCVCEEFSGELIVRNEYGENYWVDADKSLELQKTVESTSHLSIDVFNRILNNDYSPFLYEEIIRLKNI
jgi:ADP-ribose pyrophosphatase YjhB (NUDIX family)